MTRSDASIAQRLASFPRGAQELSAARLARDVASALVRAFDASGRKKQDVAQDLGVTAGAVSHVLNGDGNLTIATFARYLRSLGYEAKLVLKPVVPGLPDIALTPTPRRRPSRPTIEAGSKIPGARSDSWTVMNSGGELFGVKVQYHDSAIPGMQRFSGECKKAMRSVHISDATPTGNELRSVVEAVATPSRLVNAG